MPASLCPPASAGVLACFRAGGLFPSSALEPAGQFVGLMSIFIAGAPKEHPAGYFANRHRDIELAGDVQEIIFHPLRCNLWAQADAHRVGRSPRARIT